MDASPGRVCVVLGMHRAGTSAVTCGLGALGVELGENLMPPSQSNNDKGFFEDLSIVAINDQLLANIDCSWWQFLGEQDVDWQALFESELGRHACEYLRRALGKYHCFGIKDPRICRLLPFWQKVFAALNITPVYVIAVRDPISVARSLAARDGLELSIGQLLWLEHYSCALRYTLHAQTLCVCYDHLLDTPDEQLARIAAFLGLPFSPRELDSYKKDFLDHALRHSKVPLPDLQAQSDVDSLALALYEHLLEVANGRAALVPQSIQMGMVQFFRGGAKQIQTSIDASSKLSATMLELLDREQQIETLSVQLKDAYSTLNLTQDSLQAVYASSSWRVTAPLRRLATRCAYFRTKSLHASKKIARKVYYSMPEGMRRKVLEKAFTHAAFIFKGTVQYENWRHLRQLTTHVAPEITSLAYQVELVKGEMVGRYAFNEQALGAYCYLPPRRTARVDQLLESMANKPLISILTPVYGVEPRYLHRLVQSVLTQWYGNWELILVEDAGPNEATRDYLRSLDSPNIRVRLLECNQGIAEATNIALSMARGSYVVFLDHDDELTADALYEVCKAINEHAADFIYSDEDKIDGDGRYSEPFFKPDWSPDSMMSIMYTCHLSCMRADLVREVGGLRSNFNGAQDYDLALRITECTNRIVHIPKVLYHWRILPTSIASSPEAKPYAFEAVRMLKQDALLRRGLFGTVEPVSTMPGQFRVNYHPQSNSKISIIIPSRDNYKVLRQCIESIFNKTNYGNYEIVVVDNQSIDYESMDYFEELSNTEKVNVLRYPHAFNFSAINNFAASKAKGDYLLFLNDDIEVVQGDWLERLLGFAELKHIGAVGAQLLFPKSRRIQHCGVLNLADGPGHCFYNYSPDVPIYFGRNVLDWNWLAVTGACMLVSRSNFFAVQGFDEDLPIAYNDIDLCIRMHRIGLYNVCCNAVQLIHHESFSRGLDHEDPQKQTRLLIERKRLYTKHPEFFMNDPYYNNNLHSNSVDFITLNY